MMSNELNDKQKRFCDEYIIDFNGTRAAIEAGYSKNSAKEIASENLTKLNIQEYISELKKSKSEELNITFDDIIKLEYDIAINGKDNDKLKALDQISKKLGFYSVDNDQRKPVTNISLKDMLTFE